MSANETIKRIRRTVINPDSICHIEGYKLIELVNAIDDARNAARTIWHDLGPDMVNTSDHQLIDPVECWPWLEEEE